MSKEGKSRLCYKTVGESLLFERGTGGREGHQEVQF